MYEKEITDYFFAYAVCEKPEPVTYCVSYSIRASMICHSLTTRCYAAQTVARWQKLAQISLRKPCNGHGVSVFRYPASKNILRLFLSYTLHCGRKQPPTPPVYARNFVNQHFPHQDNTKMRVLFCTLAGNTLLLQRP